MKNSKVYIFSSPKDTVVPKLNSDRLYEFYANFIPKNQIFYQSTVNAGHSWVTNSYGNLKVSRAPKAVVNAQLYQFDQTEFQSQNSALHNFGYIYVPKACMESRRSSTMDACKLHVALHGCLQNPSIVQDKFAVNSGLNTWAEANNIVILYPQANVMSGNPKDGLPPTW
ncbi:MAG: hypothetical protein B7Y39_18720 [Bdellovibrio sp. 28-41-41]|nr:MAG: hypothetical protein B7Y39_18720 [Bdellovibrio sp. 28-41-41]